MSDSNTEQELLNPSRARLEVEDQDQVEDQLLGSSWPSAQGTHTELDNNAIIEKPTKPKAKTRPPSPNSADPPPSLPDKQHMPQQEMFAAVCEAIGWDHNTLSKEDKGQVAQACGILSKANYSVDDIRRFMVEIWFKDWRWAKEGQHPTLKQLRQEIGKTRSLIPGVAPPPKSTNNGTTAIQDYKARKGMVSR